MHCSKLLFVFVLATTTSSAPLGRLYSFKVSLALSHETSANVAAPRGVPDTEVSPDYRRAVAPVIAVRTEGKVTPDYKRDADISREYTRDDNEGISPDYRRDEDVSPDYRRDEDVSPDYKRDDEEISPDYKRD